MGGNEEDEVEDENDDDDITFSSSVALSDILYFLVVDIYAKKNQNDSCIYCNVWYFCSFLHFNDKNWFSNYQHNHHDIPFRE